MTGFRVTAIAGALALIAGAAQAAGVPAAGSQATSKWAGLYFGGQVGFGSGTITDHSDMDHAPVSGLSVVGEAGYNWAVGNKIILGLAGEFGWGNENALFDGFDGDQGFRGQIVWERAVLGRLGFDGGALLPYLEGGPAWADAGVYGPITDHTVFGGWTVGAGIARLVSQHMSANLEYRYTDYGTALIFNTPTSLTNNTVTVGLDWHFQ